MQDKDRGKIIHRDRARQIRDFSGLRWNDITPTDIDAFVDFVNEVMIIIELKLQGSKMPRGQKLAYERLTTALSSSGKKCLFILAEHDTPVEEDVAAAEAIVVSAYDGEIWYDDDEGLSLKTFIDLYLVKGTTHWWRVETYTEHERNKSCDV